MSLRVRTAHTADLDEATLGAARALLYDVSTSPALAPAVIGFLDAPR